MKQLNADFTVKKNAQTNSLRRLYTVFDYDGAGTNLYLAEDSQNIVFGGITYIAFPITFDNVSENSNGEADQMQITVSNVSRQIEAYLQAYSFRDKKVTITYVFADALADSAQKYEETLYIDSYTSDAKVVTFTLSTKLDITQKKLPLKTVLSTHCQWVFKGGECKYAGVETTCDRTLQRCRQLSNTLNYGGFPGAGGKRMFV